MLKRLQNSSPTYNFQEWQKHHKNSSKYSKIRSQHQNLQSEKKYRKNYSSNSSDLGTLSQIGNLKKLFGSSKQSERVDGGSIFDDGEGMDGHSVNPYNYDRAFLPELHVPSTSNSFIASEPNPCSAYDEHSEYQVNMKRLSKIRNSVKSVDKFQVIKKRRLYQGIVIISQKEFYLDMFLVKNKFIISAIELGKKKPYMIELYINQAKKLLAYASRITEDQELFTHENFNALVMMLQFKFDKLSIRNMNKILYEDYSAFASVPAQKKKTPKATPRGVAREGYQEFFKNSKAKSTPRSIRDDLRGSAKVKDRLIVTKNMD